MLAAGSEPPRRRGGPGGPGGPGGNFGERGGGGGRGARGGGRGGERRPMQTIYVLPGGEAQATAANVKLKPVKVRLGITDGIYTEVIEGIIENDVIVTGTTAPANVVASPGGQNPFGGGGGQRGGGFRR